jgi:hypothetical protein
VEVKIAKAGGVGGKGIVGLVVTVAAEISFFRMMPESEDRFTLGSGLFAVTLAFDIWGRA